MCETLLCAWKLALKSGFVSFFAVWVIRLTPLYFAGKTKASNFVPMLPFQFLREFPKRNCHILLFLGEAMVTERKDGFFGKRPFRRNKEECTTMKNNNQLNIPQAREAMDKFKMQAAQEVGVNLTNGYNGHLTSREAGSVGGQMVKKMIEAYEQGMQ